MNNMIGLTSKDAKEKKQKRTRKRSASEEEAELLKSCEHTEIADIDIRENSKSRIRFRKMPWCELSMVIIFWAGAIGFLLYMYIF